jgi:hypothetical protein
LNTKKLAARSILIITVYYKDNLEPYFDALHDDVLWYGPAKGQFLQGRDQMIRAWESGNHNLTFTMGDIDVQTASNSASYCEVVLSYKIYTHFPSGNNLQHDQRLHFTWVRCRRKDDSGGRPLEEKILMLHVYNLQQRDSRDSIYPVHYEGVAENNSSTFISGRHIMVNGVDKAAYYLLSGTVMWAESADRGRHCVIHTRERTLKVNEPLSVFLERDPEMFLRIHASYIVNPLYVDRIVRFRVLMSDGAVLPVPEKKYTAVKRKLLG